MPLFADRVKELTATSGTGTVTLSGASPGYQTFANAFLNGDAVYYCIVSGTDWETGIGTYTSNTLSRDSVYSSSAFGAKITLAGSAEVFCTASTIALQTPMSIALLSI